MLHTDNGSNFVKAFNEYGDSETEDDLEDTDDVQFADVTTALEEEQEHEELNFFLPPHHSETTCLLSQPAPRGKELLFWLRASHHCQFDTSAVFNSHPLSSCIGFP